MSTTSWTYSTLQSAILDWTEADGDSDFEANIQNIIALGTDQLIRDLDLEIFNDFTSGTINGGANLLGKPSTAIQINNLWVTTSNGLKRLKKRTYIFCVSYWPNLALGNEPEYYAEYDENQVFIVPTADQNYSYTAQITARPTPLSPSNSTNWLAEKAGDILLFSCLKQSELFLQAREQQEAPAWSGEYERLLPVVKKELTALVRAEDKVLQASPTPSTAEEGL